MCTYRERLWLPLSWWPLGGVTAAIFILFMSYDFAWFYLVAFLVIVAACAISLLAANFTTITVTGTELRVGRQRLPLAHAGMVQALNADQLRALRGPRADPAAMLTVRPYMTAGVYIEVTDGPPYWLVGSRRPAELAAAVVGARPAAAGTGEGGAAAQ